MVELSRRDVLRASGLAVLGGALAGSAAACAREKKAPTADPGQEPKEAFTEPRSKLSGELKILLWSHFVPGHDKWFDPFAKRWGERVGVTVTVEHIDQAEIHTRLRSEVSARQGHDLVQYIATLSSYEQNVHDLKDVVDEASKRWGEQLPLCRKSTVNPKTGKFYAFSPGWSPDPGDYRRSLWSEVGLPNGPSTWDELLAGGTEIKQKKKIPVGLGMSQEIDSNMAAWALLWSFGGAVQDTNERVVLNSPETVAAVEFMSKLYRQAMTDEVFAYKAVSNNQGLIAGQLSYILNSISAWRSAQETNTAVADDIYFTRALRGPKAALAAQHVMYNWVVPTFARNADAAKEFLLHYTQNFPLVTYHSRLYDLPAWPKLVPQVDTWLGKDPYKANPADKLKLLSSAVEWSANVGHPGPTSIAIGELLDTFVLPTMMARAARGQLSPAQAVAEADVAARRVFDKYRNQGLIGG